MCLARLRLNPYRSSCSALIRVTRASECICTVKAIVATKYTSVVYYDTFLDDADSFPFSETFSDVAGTGCAEVGDGAIKLC